MNEFDESNEVEHHIAIESLTKKFSKELSAGTSALVLLSILSNAKQPLYGYQIGRLLNTDKQGAIYPVLRNMEAKGLLYSETQPSESGPPRKYFTISPLGKAVLVQWQQVWTQTQQLVNQAILSTAKGENDAH
ncbi:PadR family transcriptional regulator [Pseudoalteromonas xiamenensis]|uniref:PadR family transcriptional regulator n=1 Tax=Pseudoalteromonas xiamenensis TaxID=882626 RepID=UPI0027E575D4|nr:PadR family transcriptional regulator [Pseudoalteromonas xiamenensis]WMN60868.1 PadR family transcriptional regulator [Pseudoalteromonas xiamenensis]